MPGLIGAHLGKVLHADEVYRCSPSGGRLAESVELAVERYAAGGTVGGDRHINIFTDRTLPAR